ncbi:MULTISPECIES: type II secretion system F family protein [unclassified Mycobacterium]|uniref:type II secretion system F family protein n=1 Tax=unclassified Mycobacterium TaxID=2642494 RepID=UPI00073FDCB2|nr:MULTISPECIES: type II secretion system F family protein [unclassified Mycobacterium]KUH80081.1 pilus assembly protein TadC [Mycobacterium sp. GA-0227b]KUH82642.1 pilus assembly protein TadC [Mycobacterium sp. GA-1999]KUH89811.1 pilus assembly protein TadC [Mycobacterium sp. IS-1556]
MTLAALLLAGALLVGGVDRRARVRGTPASSRGIPDGGGPGDPLAFASTLDVLAACLRSGMAVSSAAAAAAPSAPRHLARLLLRAADLLALGADPSTAWATPPDVDRHADALLRLARRSASSGTALAQGVTELAGRSRDDAADAARAAAERASVLIAGPLGVCYLPAFVCLGIVPVVAGLAGDVLQSGIL